jgi:branched-chain amino acid transport system ATP-binding protein
MGRTFQISNVFTELSLLENVVLALMGTVSRKWTVHRSVGHYPELRSRALDGLDRVGLKARADDSVNDLSYGDRRQLEMALALNTNPKILLLDEPCAGLSPSERQGIAKMISTLPRDITLIMIEHDMDIALALADSVTVLHRGKIIVEGSPAEVQANSEVRDVYFGNI